MLAKYRIGITATDRRSDGLEPILYAHVGPVLYRGDDQDSLDFRVVATDTGSRYEPPPEDEDKPWNWHRCLNVLIGNAQRNFKIAQAIASEADEYCLVVTHRRAHIPVLKEALKKFGLGCASLTGDTPTRRREGIFRGVEKGNIHVVITTLQLIKEGVDCPKWNRLFLATSIRDYLELEQVIGRVRRKHPFKEEAVVYDFADLFIGPLYNHFRRRSKLYQDMGAPVEKTNFI
jgi:superfamily II DNA or RNA helicase